MAKWHKLVAHKAELMNMVGGPCPLGPLNPALSLSVKLDFQPLFTLKQKSRNRLDVENDLRLVLIDTPQ